VGGRVGIAGDYADLEPFFVGKLGIKRPTIADWNEQLKELSRSFQQIAGHIDGTTRCILQSDSDEGAIGDLKTVVSNMIRNNPKIPDEPLEEHGIGPVDAEQYPDNTVVDTRGWGRGETDSTAEHGATAKHQTTWEPHSAPVSQATGEHVTVDVGTADLTSQLESLTLPVRTHSRSPYSALLENVVNMARTMSFPPFQLDRNGVPPTRVDVEGDPFGDRSRDGFGYRSRMGAAGELFVSLFEYLGCRFPYIRAFDSD
jgi:hypothetical protein